MLKRLYVWMLFLLLAVPALAEEIPTLPGTFVLSGLPKGMTFTVYTGPGKTFYVANAGKAKVSTNDVIHCYGRVDDEWLMVSYEIGEGKSRIGYISMAEYPQYMPDCRVLDFGHMQLQINHAFITDDPYGTEQVIGTFHEKLTVLAWTSTGNWAYVEGTLSEYSAPARGFIQRRNLSLDHLVFDLPQRANVHDHVALEVRYELNLPDDAMADGMNVYPLADGSYLIAYRCEGSDKLWMRVVSSTGKKLFAKSVPELYLSQITLTETGFICQTFDNPEADSGMQYTYTCKGHKWASRKVSYIEEEDRFYSDNTAHFAVRRYVFCGGSVFPITVTNLTTGAEARHQMSSYPHSYKPFVYEMDGKLLLCGGDETGAYTLRVFGDQAEELHRIPMPEGMPDQNSITSATHDNEAVYCYAGYGSDWQRWRLDRTTMTFDPKPLRITVPANCTLTAVAPTVPYHLVLMDTAYSSMLCDVTNTGTLMRVSSMNGRAILIDETDTCILLLQPDALGELVLEYYQVH